MKWKEFHLNQIFNALHNLFRDEDVIGSEKLALLEYFEQEIKRLKELELKKEKAA